MTTARYRLYREHKFVSFVLSSFSREVAKADFRTEKTVSHIKKQLSEIKALIHGHAEHEDRSIHQLLRDKGSSVFERIETDHAKHESIFKRLNDLLENTLGTTISDERVELGHHFYLLFQQFEGLNLLHQFHEETVIMPELQRLYSDKELLEKIEAKTYDHMTPRQMVHMMETLFDHFNASDRRAFLKDIFTAQPEKFLKAWHEIAPKIDEDERVDLIEYFSIEVQI